MNVEIFVYFNGNELENLSVAAAVYCISHQKPEKLISNKRLPSTKRIFYAGRVF